MKVNNSKENNKNSPEKKNYWPATLYVEGQDQFRGWYNSSLITSVILTGQPPYKQVLSHGFVVDEKGHKMSKSLGNVVDPEDVLTHFGADILRLWVISCDFTKEIKISISILENLRENYRKIRNTFRFLLGNLANLPPNLKEKKDLTQELSLTDYYILHQLEKLTADGKKNYNEYNFNPIYSSLLNFCINDLSAFYFEISKDSLYCDSLASPRRNQIITTLYYLLWGLLKIISPILPFLAEEVYQNIPFNFGFADFESVHLINWPPKINFSPDRKKEIQLITDYFFPLRDDVYQLLEKARQENIITTISQASLLIHIPNVKNPPPKFFQLNLTELLMVAEIRFTPALKKDMVVGDFCSLYLEKTQLKRCLRCWNYREKKKDLCGRCCKVLAAY